jgi:hypothetical protein
MELPLRRCILFCVGAICFEVIPASTAQFNLTVPRGYSLISIPANIVGGTTPNNLFPNVSPETSVSRAPSPTFDLRTFDPDVGDWTDSSPLSTLGAYWFYCPPAGPQTFTWEISGPPVAPPIVNLESNKYHYLGARNPGPSTYEDFVGATPLENTTLLRHIRGSAPTPKRPPYWIQYDYYHGAWSPTNPIMDTAEGIIVIHPSLRLKHTPANAPAGMVLEWPRGQLQTSLSANGPWQDVPNASSPYRVDAEAEPGFSRFYRIVEASGPFPFGGF